jgi:glycosyltransferase involved in cell wall biosynthesis
MPGIRQRIHLPLKEFVERSPLTQLAYAAILYRRAMAHWRRGRPYHALHQLCTAHRRIRNPLTTARHLRAMVDVYRDTCWRDGGLATHAQNGLYRLFAASDDAQRTRVTFMAGTVADRVRIRDHYEDDDFGRQGHLMILKAPDMASGEKGVLMLTYNFSFAALPAMFRLSELLQQYTVVLEPSYSRNFEPSLFLYAGSDSDVILASSYPEDHEFVHRMQLGIHTVSLGASDWVDTDAFVPVPEAEREYDVVMVASWMALKRHCDLFGALAAIHPRRLRTALIGYPADLNALDIRRDMRRHGVESHCELFENLPIEQVARILARSKVALHWSKQEGSNKATYEALSCDTPLIVYRHNLGFPMQAINSSTGVLADDYNLAQAIEWMVDHWRQFQPRRWLLANTGYERSTMALNDSLQTIARERGAPWTRNIVHRVNRINPRYKFDDDRLAMEPAYDKLAELLWPC